MLIIKIYRVVQNVSLKLNRTIQMLLMITNSTLPKMSNQNLEKHLWVSLSLRTTTWILKMIQLNLLVMLIFKIF